ncbi:MAG TPA: TonB-dependent receptor [Terracidiphilus sp.]|nr:TonB-dependent receptor [Terracidiphilus sp.]
MGRKLLANALLLAAVFVFFLCQSGTAQISNGTIRGTVSDLTGAVLPQAGVTLTNEGTAAQFTTQSNQEGYYTFTALSPGQYEIQVVAPGFDTWKGELTLRVAQEAVIDAQMKPGKATSTVTVTDVTPVIDAGDGTVSDVKNATQINTLPVENSDFVNLLNFSPGVVAGNYGGAGGGYTRVDGIPGGSITFQVDGQSMNDRYTNDLQQTPQALQTIQELKVTTSNGSAEYSTPGVVDVVTKGGTNQFHGEAHELYQTGGLEAQGYNAYPSHLVHNEFGGQLGGPVLLPKLYNGRDKTFFYFDAEKLIQHGLAGDEEYVPQTDWTKGDFSDYTDTNGNPVTIYDPMSGVPSIDASGNYVVTRTAFPGNKIPQALQNPIAAAVLGYLPAPNENVNSSGVVSLQGINSGYDWLNPMSFKSDSTMRYTGKVDEIMGKNLLSARYTYVNDSVVEPDQGGYAGLLDPSLETRLGHNGVLSFTTPIHSNMVNEARVGIQMFRNYIGSEPAPSSVWSLGLPKYPGAGGWPQFYWTDVNQPYLSNGIQSQNPQWSPNQNATLGDNYSWTRGRHEMKFGFQVVNSRVNTLDQQNPSGDYEFAGGYTGLQPAGTSLYSNASDLPSQAAADTGAALADMLLGDVDVAQLNIDPIFHTRQTDYDAFAQDNFKLSPRLTLNLGVRWEYWSPFDDAGGQASTIDLNHSASCVIPASLGNASGTPCVPLGSTGFPAWFSQSTPMTVIPNGGKGQNPALLAAFAAAGMPLETASQAGIPNSLWNMPKNNWAPRLGFAYQINDKTVVRGGYGMYYWSIPLLQYQRNTRNNAPFAQVIYDVIDPSIGQGYGGNPSAELGFPFGPSVASTPNGYQGQCNCSTLPANYVNPRSLGTNFATTALASIQNTSGWLLNSWDPNYHAQRAQEYNLTVERTLPGDWAVSVGYVGNHGANLPDYDPINAPLPRALTPSTAQGNSWNIAPYPIYNTGGEGNGDRIGFYGYSNHNEARAEVKHTFKGSFLVQSFFTYGRSLTTAEDTLGAGGGLELEPAALTQNAPLSERLRDIYAPDSYMPEKTFVANGHYELPLGKNKQFLNNSNTLVNEAVSGWNSSLFYTWHSGLFFSPFYSSDPGYAGQGAPFGNEYILAPGSANRGILPRNKRTAAEWFDSSKWDPASGVAYAGQTFEVRDNLLDRDYLNGIPRNYMTGPGFSNADGSLYKVTPIGEHMKFDLEMQVFNVFNHTNLGLPRAKNGVISTGEGTPRLLQFQGKLTF